MKRVLVVDDSAICRRLAAAALKATFTVDTAADGKQAARLVRNNQYSLILMDLDMPEINGIDATFLIRAIEQFNQERAVIVAYSASELDRADECLSVGMDACLKKPLPPDRLIEKLELLLRDTASTTSDFHMRWSAAKSA